MDRTHPRYTQIGGAPLAALISLGLYLFTLSPGLNFGDSGELITGGATLGIVHPPGYSLFLVIAKLFLILPIPGDIAWRMNLFTALCGACGIALLFLFLKGFLSRLDISASATDSGALCGALLFAFSQTWWSQCVITEVYTFQIMLVAALLLSLERKRLPLAWFLMGLCVIAHPSSALLFPLCVWRSLKTMRISPKRAARYAALFGLGLSPALFLYVRGLSGPWQDCSQIGSFGEAMAHLTRRDYGGIVWRRTLVLGWMFKHYALSVFNQWSFLGIVLGGAGFVLLRRQRSRLADLWLVCFLVTGPLATLLLTGLLSPSQQMDFEPFCLLSYLMLTVVIAIAIAVLIDYRRIVGLGVAMLVLGAVCAINGPKVTQAKNRIPERYTEILISNIPKGAVVLPLKDSTAYALDYAIGVKRLRNDISIDRFNGKGEALVNRIDDLIGAGGCVLTDLTPETWPLRDRMRSNGLFMDVRTTAQEGIPDKFIENTTNLLSALKQSTQQRMAADPSSLEGRMLSAHFVDLGLLIETRNPNKARGLFLEAISWNPRNVDAHVRLADMAIKSGELDSARDHLNAAISSAPYTAPVYLVRGRLHLAEGSLSKAIQDWEQARRIESGDTLSRLLLAKAYMELNRPTESKRILVEILQIDPNHSDARRLLAELGI